MVGPNLATLSRNGIMENTLVLYIWNLSNSMDKHANGVYSQSNENIYLEKFWDGFLQNGGIFKLRKKNCTKTNKTCNNNTR